VNDTVPFRQAPAWLRPDRAFFRWIKRLMPRGLYMRALLILVTPVILTQAIATHVFFERHWKTVSNRLAFAFAGEVAVIAEEMDRGNPKEVVKNLQDTMDRNLYLTLHYAEGEKIDGHLMRGDYSSIFAQMLIKALEEKVARPYALDLLHDHEWFAVHVQLKHGMLTVIAPERRIYTPTVTIFIIWMFGSSILLSCIAILFLRNQIRPIRRLAKAAEAIGKGQDMPDFKPEGAREVRQAAVNLLIMRDRLRRGIAQRTAMLNGVSHDLRTPLTRMKLQLALMKDDDKVRGLKSDVEEMSQMVEAYLAFARGDEAEENSAIELPLLLEEVAATAKRANAHVHVGHVHPMTLPAKPTAIKRALNNLIGNAIRYGNQIWIHTGRGKKYVDIIIDDDGPGIPADMREDVFRPFTRLESSRNRETGGMGLGLTVARDIAHHHGGDVILSDSPKGGLRATLRLPL
jgi:two-component system osmolarity sensor histidine kinase EnvZ